MKFEIDTDAIKDKIAIYGREYAIDNIVDSFRAGLETVVDGLEQGETA